MTAPPRPADVAHAPRRRPRARTLRWTAAACLVLPAFLARWSIVEHDGFSVGRVHVPAEASTVLLAAAGTAAAALAWIQDGAVQRAPAAAPGGQRAIRWVRNAVLAILIVLGWTVAGLTVLLGVLADAG